MSLAIVGDLSHRLARQGGAALIVDYGHDRPGRGDTLQSVFRHAYADPFEAPGERDLTAHVDFSALAAAAQGVRVSGPVAQGDWLDAMGLPLRAAALAKAAPARAEEIAEAPRPPLLARAHGAAVQGDGAQRALMARAGGVPMSADHLSRRHRRRCAR